MWENLTNCRTTYIDHLNIHLVNLRSFRQDPCGFIVEGPTLVGLREVLKLENLEFPILLNEREGEDSLIFEIFPTGGSEFPRELRHNRVS